MTTDDIVTSFTPMLERDLNMGVQKVYRFANGFGASVVQGPFSYGGKDGLWELGVIRFEDEANWDLTYDTPITSDVIGYQTGEEIGELLARIESLDADGQEPDDASDADFLSEVARRVHDGLSLADIRQELFLVYVAGYKAGGELLTRHYAEKQDAAEVTK